MGQVSSGQQGQMTMNQQGPKLADPGTVPPAQENSETASAPVKKRRTPADPNKPKTKRTKSSTTVSTLVQNIDAANQAQSAAAEAAKTAQSIENNTAPAPATQPAEDKTVHSNTSVQYQPSPSTTTMVNGQEPLATESPKSTPRPQQQQQLENNHSPSLFINQKLFESSSDNSSSSSSAKVEVKLDFSRGAPSDMAESESDLISSYSAVKYNNSSTEPSSKLEYHLSADSSTVSVRLPGSMSAGQASALSISSSLPSSSSSASSSSSELEMDDLLSKTAHPSKLTTT